MNVRTEIMKAPATLTVHDIRRLGLKITIVHNREIGANNQVLARGGVTQITIVSPYVRDVVIMSDARCRPDENYSRKIGVQTAINRINLNTLRELLRRHHSVCARQFGSYLSMKFFNHV